MRNAGLHKSTIDWDKRALKSNRNIKKNTIADKFDFVYGPDGQVIPPEEMDNFEQ